MVSVGVTLRCLLLWMLRLSPGKPESMETELMRAELLRRAEASRLLTLAVSLSVKTLVDSGVDAAVCNHYTCR